MSACSTNFIVTRNSLNGQNDFEIGDPQKIPYILIALSTLMFNLGLWIFVFNYYALSCTVELTLNNKPPGQYKNYLTFVNASVSFFTISTSLLAAILWDHHFWYDLFLPLTSASLIFSVVYLSIGLNRLKNLSKEYQDLLINNNSVLRLVIICFFVLLATIGMAFFGSRSKNHFA